jgi:CheY-like chemotaxis protein
MNLRMAGKKILVADDSLTIQKVIRLALSGDGYEIQTVSDGKEAIEQASLFRPDICIIDVSLPKYDAYEIREKFIQQADLKSIPVILMSSAFEKVDETRANQLGFSGHLVKPFDPSHLRSTLLSVSDRAPDNDPVMETINTPADLDSLPEVGSLDDLGPLTLSPPRHSTGFEEFPPLSNDFQGGLDDIQELAKNTFEMSGLNQHDWGMIEIGKTDGFGSDFDSDLEPEIESTPLIPSRAEVSAMNIPEAHAAPSSEARFNAAEVEAMIKAEVARVLEEMHFQIQDRINHEMKQVSEEIIPNLAEKIIKDEIHKLLTNPPL